MIHTHDCPTAAKSRTDPDKWLDVEWAPEHTRPFDVGVHLTVINQRGVLAKVAGVIAAGGANIDNVIMDEERGAYTEMRITLQVADRQHLARIKRGLRHLAEVVRIARERD